MVNYRDLLVKYIRHVGNEEGVTFIRDTMDKTLFDDEEITMLKLLEIEGNLLP